MVRFAGLCITAALASGCGSNKEQAAPPADQDLEGTEPGGSAGPGDAAGEPVGNDDVEEGPSDAGPSQDASGSAGGGFGAGDAARDASPAVCGDGIVDGEREDCEREVPMLDPDSEVTALSCVDLGFSGGELRCDDDCRFDTSACVGGELCADARDNDGDMLVDCEDDDCEAACADSCSEPVELSALGEGQALRVQGTNAGHAQQIQPSCAAGSGGREVVYRYVPVLDGTLELQVESSSLLVVSAARMPCATDADAGAASELGCELVGRSLQLAVRSGESVYVIVDGRDEGDEGPYALTLRERSVECGNGFREAGEACDDGNANDSDGCTTQCVLNATEAEPNDTIAEANDYENPFYGAIEPSNDVDVVRFEIVESSDVALRVIDLGDGACEDGRMDPRIRVYDENDAVVGEDDDGGSGFCSELRLDAVAAGAYHAEISRVSLGAETFPYRLTVTMAPVP